jgi:ABC-type branched-subunit amino acid transport system substrate-binding protein
MARGASQTPRVRARARCRVITRSMFGVLALVVVFLTTATAASAHPDGGRINVGVIAGFTGSYVGFSDEMLNGVQVAAYEINKAGGVMGKKIHVSPVNDGLDPVDTVPAVQKMLAVNHISLEAGLAALDYTAGLPLLNKAKMVSVSYIGPDYGPTVMPYHWNMDPSDSELGLAMAYYAHQKGYKNIALVFDTSLGAQSIVPSVKFAAAKLHLKIVASPTIPENVTSYQSAITEVVNAHPDAVLMQVEPAQAGAFFQQWQSLGADSFPLVGTDATLDPEFLQAAGSNVISHLVSVEGINDTSSPFYKSFVAAWSKVVKQQFSYVGSYLYDGVVMAALAMVEAKSTNPQVYYKYISHISQPGRGKTTVYSYAQGLKLLKAGKKIKYSGITGPLIFNKYHRPTGDYGVYVGAVSGNPTQVGAIKGKALVGLQP